ncbi:MAG: hypothetical protein FRX49_07698 [Trebouxia sp. A1-2]|nr:MAG: hypothetical protein FRX49_07698 [Trebouxia sp. A1-2]
MQVAEGLWQNARMTGVRHEFLARPPNPYGANKSDCARCKKKTEDEIGTLLTYLPGQPAPAELYPADLCDQTTKLVNSYLQEEDTLVLCVADATIPSMDSSIAVKMVRDNAKLPSTILALTKADLIKDEESIVEHIFERVLNRSKEIADLPGLAGCVAVVNRLHQDKVSLVDAEAAEEAVFNELFEDPAEAYAPKTVQQQLRQNTTTAQLIAKLDHLFSAHIKQSWMPSVLQSIQDTMIKITDQIGDLGPSPDAVDPAKVLRIVTSKQIQGHLASLARPGAMPSTFTLTEDDSTSAARATLLDKLRQLKAAMQTINQIAGIPVTGSYAFVTHTGKPQLPLDTDKSMLETESGHFSADCGYRIKWPVPQIEGDPLSSKIPSMGPVCQAKEDPVSSETPSVGLKPHKLASQAEKDPIPSRTPSPEPVCQAKQDPTPSKNPSLRLADELEDFRIRQYRQNKQESKSSRKGRSRSKLAFQQFHDY